MKNKSTLFLVQAALIGAIYVSTYPCVCTLQLWRSPGTYLRSTDHPSLFYTGSNPRIICRMYHCQYPGRLYPGRHHLRKHCHTAGRSFYLQAS